MVINLSFVILEHGRQGYVLLMVVFMGVLFWPALMVVWVLHVGYHPDGLGQSDWSGIPGVFVGPTDGDFWVQRIDYPLLRAVPKAG